MASTLILACPGQDGGTPSRPPPGLGGASGAYRTADGESSKESLLPRTLPTDGASVIPGVDPDREGPSCRLGPDSKPSMEYPYPSRPLTTPDFDYPPPIIHQPGIRPLRGPSGRPGRALHRCPPQPGEHLPGSGRTAGSSRVVNG